jgi:predicted amidohydrolase YtcJ
VTTTLLRNGHIHTPDHPNATALLVTDDRISWLGNTNDTNHISGIADIARAGSDGVDHVVELDGALVTPAFVDAHVHSTSTGIALQGLDLSDTRSLAECLERVATFTRRTRGRVILGHGWDETTWPEHRAPTRQELDRASYGGVVYLSRIDVHSAVVSSALLAAAPEARDAVGFQDSGHLSTEAHHVVRRVARESVGPEQRRTAQRATRRRAAELGIGSLHELGGPDISSEEDFRAMLALTADEPGPDVIGYWGELGGAERARELGALGAAGDLFADGAIGSHTACLRSVYADDDQSGHAYLTAAQVRDHVAACTVAGVQAGFHAIGDGALDAVTAGFREAADRVGAEAIRQARHRIEHVEMVDAAMIATLADLGVVASVQPAFDRLWGGEEGMYVERLGADRARTLNPFAAMAAGGVVLALGSDAPVTPLDPWGTVRAAARHRTPGQSLSVSAAFAAHTVGGWHAAHMDGGGILRVGSAATLAVWTGHTGPGLPALEPDDELPACRLTVVRGTTVYDAAD